jgi:MFS transporter, OFA family, oxalate/formate antiporter
MSLPTPIPESTITGTKPTFFYGWIVLGAVVLIYASGTIGVSTIPLLNVKLRTALNLTHEQVVLGPSLLFLIMGLLSPVAGYLLDSLNPKRLLVIGWVCFIAALVLYSFITTFWQFMAFYALYALGSVCTGVIPGMFLISKWFQKYRGMATGIFTVGSSLGGTIFPRFAGYLLETMPFQTVALWLAGATAVFAVVPWFFVRLTPESVGATVDGLPLIPAFSQREKEEERANAAFSLQPSSLQPSSLQPSSLEPSSLEPSPSGRGQGEGKHTNIETLQTALRTAEFYVILLVTAAVWFSIQPLVQNLSFHLKDVGVEPSKAGAILSTLFFCSIGGKLFFGWLSDYRDKKTILFVATLNMTLGAVLIRLTSVVQAEWLFYCAAVVYGLGFSGSFTMVQLLVAERYSRSKDFGKILGVVTTADSLAVVVGVYLLGALRTAQGNYEVAFTVMIASGLAAAAGVLVLKRFRER